MAQSCWACGQQNDGGSTHCVNPACGLPLTPARPTPADASVIRTRPCYLRMLALPAGITMVIILAAVHALMAPMHGSSRTGNADSGADSKTNSQLTPLTPHPSTSTPGASPTPAPMIFPLPVRPTATAGPGGPPGASPAQEHDGPVSGAYTMRSLSGGCFDIGYMSNQTPMVTQKPCTSGAPMVRFGLEALGLGRYRMTAAPQRGIHAGLPLCLGAPGTDKMVLLDDCETTRDDQILVFVETSQDWYQIQVSGACVTATGRDARTRTCGSSQTQRFTFTPVH